MNATTPIPLPPAASTDPADCALRLELLTLALRRCRAESEGVGRRARALRPAAERTRCLTASELVAACERLFGSSDEHMRSDGGKRRYPV